MFKKRLGKDRTMTTYRSRVVARDHVAAFIKSFYRRTDMSMLEITPDFIKDIPFQVKLLDIPLQIIKRYETNQEDCLIFPNLNYWSICKPLKKVMKECGITKDISFHTARHHEMPFGLKTGRL